MFTSNQQRCLIELGIVPLALRGAESDNDMSSESSINTASPGHTSSNSNRKPEANARPSLTSLLKPQESRAGGEKTTLAQPETKAQPISTFDWQTHAPQVLADLTIIFPDINAYGYILTLPSGVTWRIVENQGEVTFENNAIVSAPVTQLSARQRSQIWAWLNQSS